MLRTGRGTRSRAGEAGPGTVALLAVAAVLAACAAPGGGTSVPGTNPPAATKLPGTGLTLAIRTDPEYGVVVTGKDGLSLYVFLNDKGDGTSACSGSCAGSWPPLTVASAADVGAGGGITGALGTITRSDGTVQVTLGGAPLYYFAADTKAGDSKGQGLNDVWYLSSPAGTPAEGAEPGATPGSSKCSGPACY